MNDEKYNSAFRNLSALVDFGNLINSSLDINFTLNNILLTFFGKFHTTKGAVFLFDNGKLKLRIIKGIPGFDVDSFPAVPSENFKADKAFRNLYRSAGIDYSAEISAGENKLGILLLGKRLTGFEYDEDDKAFISTLLNIGATALVNALTLEKLKSVNKQLDSKVNQLSSLFDLSKEFSGILDEKRVGKLLMFSLIGQLLVSKFAIVINENTNIKIIESKFDKEKLSAAFEKCSSCNLTLPVRKNELDDLNPEFSELGIELIVPMQIQNETKGLILLGRRNTGGDFSQTDIEFVYSVGSVAVISIENARLFREALEKQRMEKDLEIAKNIQRNLLPDKIPAMKNFQISAVNRTAKQVGGDYYDAVKLDDNNLLIAIGDVSGKSVQAALLMANVQAFLKSIVKQNIPLDKASNLINDLVSENTSGGSFITFFWGVLNDADKKFTFVNMGHNPPLLIRNNKIRKLKTGGMILGVMETITPYNSETVQLQSGDALIAFTDGVTEAMDASENEYSDERLEQLALKISSLTSDEILNSILDDVRLHTNGAVQSDDITLMIVKVL